MSEREKAFRKLDEYLSSPEHQESLKQQAEARDKELDENPDNGKNGWWRVCGIRHNALVRGSSAREVVDKASVAQAVGGWEDGRATWIGEELPDVVSL